MANVQVEDWELEVRRILILPEDEIDTEIKAIVSERLVTQDKSPYNWRITNALAAVRREDTSGNKGKGTVRKIMAIFKALKTRGMNWLAQVEDIDGDMPLHNACNSRNLQTVELLLHFFPDECSTALQTPNNLKLTPLQIALIKNDWDNLKLLLTFCIQYKICYELIGIGPSADTPRKTLMHEAMARGVGFDYMKTFLPVVSNQLGNDAAKSSLVNFDEVNNSPWYHLVVNGDLDTVQNVLAVVKEFLPDIKFSQLYINRKEQTMLHQAYTDNRNNLKVALEDLFEEKEPVDIQGKRPHEKSHSLEPEPAPKRKKLLVPIQTSERHPLERHSVSGDIKGASSYRRRREGMQRA